MENLQDKLKDIVLNVKTPHLINSVDINWPCFQMSFNEWCTQYDNSLTAEQIAEGGIVFDTGKRTHSNSPQWEKLRGKTKLTVKNFYDKSDQTDEFFKTNWAAFSYKNIKELPAGCTRGFDFTYFGFPDVKDDITFWLSSTDAHTPCHFDTYGCNVVVQVYGKKAWMLFPPGAKLTPTRIPYEESSVYCTETFFSPKSEDLYEAIEDSCYSCVLNPGDVLIVPPKWWHYVENICPSLSVNAWIPIEADIQTHIEECIVRILMKNFIEDANFSDIDVLNPNEFDLLDDQYDLFEILQYLTVQERAETINSKHKHNYLSDQELATVLNDFKDKVRAVPKLTKNNFREIMKKRTERFDSSIQCDPACTSKNNIKYHLINSVCNPSIVSQIAAEFLCKINQNTK